MAKASFRSVCSFLASMTVVAFTLNWFWEMSQMRAYVQMATVPWTDTLLPCTWAALGDVVFALLIYGIGALASGDIAWALTGRVHVLAAVAVFGAIAACAYEWHSQLIGRWTYSDAMLIVPALHVGLWPMLQLVITLPLAFVFGAWFCKWREVD